MSKTQRPTLTPEKRVVVRGSSRGVRRDRGGGREKGKDACLEDLLHGHDGGRLHRVRYLPPPALQSTHATHQTLEVNYLDRFKI